MTLLVITAVSLAGVACVVTLRRSRRQRRAEALRRKRILQTVHHEEDRR